MKLVKKLVNAYLHALSKNPYVLYSSGMIPYNYNGK